jgi:hypothetical protein
MSDAKAGKFNHLRLSLGACVCGGTHCHPSGPERTETVKDQHLRPRYARCRTETTTITGI